MIQPRNIGVKKQCSDNLNGTKLMKSMITIVAVFLAASFAARAADDVEKLWKTNCLSCHGKDGTGKTKAGRKAGVKDMTEDSYQKEVTDEKALAAMKDGLKGEDGTVKMKPFADKLSDADMKALLAKVRSFKKQ
jgi:cytochrome c553